MNIEQRYYVELRFPKRDLIEIVEKEDKEALFELVSETLQNYMQESG